MLSERSGYRPAVRIPQMPLITASADLYAPGYLSDSFKIPNINGCVNYEIWETRTQAILSEKGYADDMVPLPEEVLSSEEVRIFYESQPR